MWFFLITSLFYYLDALSQRYRIWEDKSNVVMPIIDGLSRQFKYSAGGVELVGFNTKLVDHGMQLSHRQLFQLEDSDGGTADPI